VKFKSQLVTQASGSIGGATFSHNRGGAYIRARTVPTNPNSPQQAVVRALMAALTALWNNTLTQAQRDGWQLYADQVLIPDTLGEPRNAGGIGMYCRSNIPRQQAGATLVNDAPTIYNLGDFTAPVFASISQATQQLSMTFDNADAWANEDDALMIVLLGRPQNPGVKYFKGPYRYAGKVEGDSGTPPTSPATIALPFAAVTGQRVFGQVRVARADGRLSLPFRATVLVSA
jgi:hypothetical protein